jgi:hypothetical protein
MQSPLHVFPHLLHSQEPGRKAAPSSGARIQQVVQRDLGQLQSFVDAVGPSPSHQLCICTALLAGAVWYVSSCCLHLLLLLLPLLLGHTTCKCPWVHQLFLTLCCLSSSDSFSTDVLTVVAQCLVRACVSACAAVMACVHSSASSA